MTCTEFEILVADLLDGTLAPELRDSFERHQHSCPACAELARDAASSVIFMSHVSAVVPPAALVPQILAATSGSSGTFAYSPRQWRGKWSGVVFRPQFAMGVAVALLSLAIAARFWTSAGIGAQRAWERTVRGYENMQVVYEVQSQLQDQLQGWMDDRAGAADGGNQ